MVVKKSLPPPPTIHNLATDYSHIVQLQNSVLVKQNVPVRTAVLKSPPPHNLTIMYGIKNAAISRLAVI
jgi:hypothetical protein